MNYFIAVIAGYRAAQRRNRKAAVANNAALAEMLLRVLTGWAALLVLLQPVTACYSLLQPVTAVTACYSRTQPVTARRSLTKPDKAGCSLWCLAKCGLCDSRRTWHPCLGTS